MGKLAKLSILKNPKVFIPLIAGLIGVLIFIVVHNMNAPAQGNISETPPNQAETVQPYSMTGHFKGKYISFNYPAHYKAVPDKLTGNYLEVNDYHTTDVTAKQISIGVYPGQIDQDSGVVYRREHKELYTENSSRLGTEFTRNDGTEDTFFIQHGNLLATVSATAPYGELSGEALFVASSLKWI